VDLQAFSSSSLIVKVCISFISFSEEEPEEEEAEDDMRVIPIIGGTKKICRDFGYYEEAMDSPAIGGRGCRETLERKAQKYTNSPSPNILLGIMSFGNCNQGFAFTRLTAHLDFITRSIGDWYKEKGIAY